VVGRYRFSEGRLKGVSVGANLRWESAKIIGYGETSRIFNFGGLENYSGRASDLSVEYRTDPVIAGGMFVGYTRKIFRNKVQWRVQLNAQNIFSETGLRAIAANADSSPVWAMNPPRVYELTNSFQF
jgi:hypothetical protein